MFLAVFIAVVPYLGIPRALDAYIYSTLGMAIFFLLLFSKRSKRRVAADFVAGVPAAREEESAPKDAPSVTLEVSHDHGELHPSIDVSPLENEAGVLQKELKQEVADAATPTRPKRQRKTHIEQPPKLA